MFRHYLIAAATLIALTVVSCSKNETEENTSPENAVGFGVYTGRETKADATLYIPGTSTNNNIPNGKSIGIFGYLYKNSTWAESYGTVTPSFFNNVQATATQSDGSAFTYAPVRYWPGSSSYKMSFIGYYPYAPSSSNTTGITPVVTTGLGYYKFAVNTDKSKQVDFMISDLAADQYKLTTSHVLTGEATGTVKLKFHHMLANVVIKVIVPSPLPENVTAITISDVKLQNVKNRGNCKPSFTGTPGSDGSTTTSFKWSSLVHDTNADFDLGVSDGSQTSDVLLMIPQSFEDNDAAVITVSYNYTVKDYRHDTDPTHVINYTGNSKSMQLNLCKSGTTLITSWEMNKKYVYNITLSPDKILFSGTVSDWTIASEDIHN
jgi:hypothetical protein